MIEKEVYEGKILDVQGKGKMLSYNEFLYPVAQKIFNLLDACDDDKSPRVEYSYYRLEDAFWYSKDFSRFVFQIEALQADDGGASTHNLPLVVDFSPEEGEKLFKEIEECDGEEPWFDMFGDEMALPAPLKNNNSEKEEDAEFHYHDDAIDTHPLIVFKNIRESDFTRNENAIYTVYEMSEEALYYPTVNKTQRFILATDTLKEGGFEERFLSVFQYGNFENVEIKEEERISAFGEEK